MSTEQNTQWYSIFSPQILWQIDSLNYGTHNSNKKIHNRIQTATKATVTKQQSKTNFIPLCKLTGFLERSVSKGIRRVGTRHHQVFSTLNVWYTWKYIWTIDSIHLSLSHCKNIFRMACGDTLHWHSIDSESHRHSTDLYWRNISQTLQNGHDNKIWSTKHEHWIRLELHLYNPFAMFLEESEDYVTHLVLLSPKNKKQASRLHWRSTPHPVMCTFVFLKFKSIIIVKHIHFPHFLLF